MTVATSWHRSPGRSVSPTSFPNSSNIPSHTSSQHQSLKTAIRFGKMASCAFSTFPPLGKFASFSTFYSHNFVFEPLCGHEDAPSQYGSTTGLWPNICMRGLNNKPTPDSSCVPDARMCTTSPWFPSYFWSCLQYPTPEIPCVPWSASSNQKLVPSPSP